MIAKVPLKSGLQWDQPDTKFHLPSGSGSDWGPGGDIVPIESELPDFEDEHLGYPIEPLPLDFPLSSTPCFYPPGHRRLLY
jgi:hypothetical protein